MVLNLIRQVKTFNKVCYLYGVSASKCYSRPYSIHGRTETPLPKLLAPLSMQHYIIKRKQRVNIQLNEHPSSKKYSILWSAEQFTNLMLVFLIPAAFLTENQEVDMAMGVMVILHSYWGSRSIIEDYMRSWNFGKILPEVTQVLLIILSIAAADGLFQLVYDDIGIANTIKKFWSIEGTNVQVSQVTNVAKQQPKWYRLKK